MRKLYWKRNKKKLNQCDIFFGFWQKTFLFLKLNKMTNKSPIKLIFFLIINPTKAVMVAIPGFGD